MWLRFLRLDEDTLPAANRDTEQLPQQNWGSCFVLSGVRSILLGGENHLHTTMLSPQRHSGVVGDK